jgi:hypothetical protein
MEPPMPQVLVCQITNKEERNKKRARRNKIKNKKKTRRNKKNKKKNKYHG